ncbi:MAG: NUDIX hydrolase [Chloroflexi bacterium]|nr:NUDIX hydrolase [Chloroflexota bacterium]
MIKEYIHCPFCGVTLQKGLIDHKKRKYCPSCDFVDYKNPLPVVFAIAVRGRRLLLIKRGIAPKKGMWACPSGAIEIGETPEEACLRELKEETGASGEIVRLVGVIKVEEEEIYGDLLALGYLVKLADGELLCGDEVEDVRFFNMSGLPDSYVDLFRKEIEEIQQLEL